MTGRLELNETTTVKNEKPFTWGEATPASGAQPLMDGAGRDAGRRPSYVELAEPLFQYVCRLNRGGKQNVMVDYAQARAEIENLLRKIADDSQSDVVLARLNSKLEMVLVYYVDSIIIQNKRLPFSEEWSRNRIADLRGYRAGDEDLFVMLDRSLQDTSEDAAEMLYLFYTCLCLGFEGMHAGQPQVITGYVERIWPRIRHLIDNNPGARICQEAYLVDHTDLSDGLKGGRAGWIVVLFVFLSLSILIVYFSLYASATDSMGASLTTIEQQSPASHK